jgi:hypothetical protein
LTASVLGRHVARRADYFARSRHPPIGPAEEAYSRNAEIDELDLVIVEEKHVGRFDVTMNHVSAVHCVQDTAKVGGNRQGPGWSKGAMLNDLGQGLTLDELHDQKKPTVRGHAEIGHSHHARVLDTASGHRLSTETRGVVRITAIFVVENLDGHRLVELEMNGSKNLPRAAAAETTL